MDRSLQKQHFDLDVRHFIYKTFADLMRPPSTHEIATHFGVGITAVTVSLTRLADAHHIVLAPGTHTIWMAHPFSSIPTNFVTQVGDKQYWGNCVWDMFGIAAILDKDAMGQSVCACGQCDERLDVSMTGGAPIDSDWIVHFLVPAVSFWDDIGFT